MNRTVQDLVRCSECGGVIEDDRKQWASQCGECVHRASKHLASLSPDHLRIVMEGNRIGLSPNSPIGVTSTKWGQGPAMSDRYKESI